MIFVGVMLAIFVTVTAGLESPPANNKQGNPGGAEVSCRFILGVRNAQLPSANNLHTK